MTPDPAVWGECFVDGVASLSCVPYLIQNIISAALAFGGVVAIFLIIWGGYKYIRSAGDPKQAEGAKQTITYAIIGLLIVFLSYFIISVIAQLTGVGCIKRFGFDNCLPAESGAATTDKSTWMGCFTNQCASYNKDSPEEPTRWYSSSDAQANLQACLDDLGSNNGSCVK